MNEFLRGISCRHGPPELPGSTAVLHGGRGLEPMTFADPSRAGLWLQAASAISVVTSSSPLSQGLPEPSSSKSHRQELWRGCGPLLGLGAEVRLGAPLRAQGPSGPPSSASSEQAHSLWHLHCTGLCPRGQSVFQGSRGPQGGNLCRTGGQGPLADQGFTTQESLPKEKL